MKKISVLGSTGSIGTQTLDVAAKHSEHFQIEGLAAGGNIALLLEQARRFKPRKVSVLRASLPNKSKPRFRPARKCFTGTTG
ncbi:1-deoxy-D-xylulose 5-phosphate reductoisomerase [Paenibacillus sp. P1XP2]|nr:1-deoxy-D-xylulose 5-phosphate reductoisomerase [Paenibacillus sp. P1XP2]